MSAIASVNSFVILPAHHTATLFPILSRSVKLSASTNSVFPRVRKISNLVCLTTLSKSDHSLASESELSVFSNTFLC